MVKFASTIYIVKYTVKLVSIQLKWQHVQKRVSACLCVTHSVSTVHTSTTYWHTHWFINNVHLGSTHWPGRFTAHSPDACVRLHQRALYFSLFLFLSAVPASQSIPQPSYLCSLSLYCPPTPPSIHTHSVSRTSGFLWTVSPSASAHFISLAVFSSPVLIISSLGQSFTCSMLGRGLLCCHVTHGRAN